MQRGLAKNIIKWLYVFCHNKIGVMANLKSKGTVALIIVVIALLVTVVFFTADTSTLFAAPPPNQVYQPTIPDADEKVVCIVFDDGWKTHVSNAQILERYNFAASYSIITSYVGYTAYMNWADIALLAQKGNDIVSHTLTHSNLSAVDEATLRSELIESRQILRAHGYGADVFIYPYGEAARNQTVVDAVAQVYQLATGTEAGKCDLYTLNRFNVNSYVVYRDTSMDQFAQIINGTGGRNVTVLYYHKVGDEGGNSVTRQEFEAQLQYLSDNGYTVKTLSQLFLKT